MSKKDLEHEKIKVSISKIQNVKQRIINSLRPFVGSVISGNDFDRATAALSFSVPKSCIAMNCSQDMLVKYLRQPFMPKDLRILATRISGNIDFIMQGNPIYDNDWRSRSDWGLMQIVGVEKAKRVFKDGTSQIGSWLDLDIHTGPASGNRIKKFWSGDMFNYAKFRIGFSHPSSGSGTCSYPFIDEQYVFNLYFLGYFDHLNLRDKPDYSKFACTDYLVSINRSLLRKRFRALHSDKNNFKCVRGLHSSVMCHRCPSGLDECEAAVKRKTYTSDECKKCGKLSWFDPDKADYCITCQTSLSLHLI